MSCVCFRLVTELVEKDETYRLSEDIDSVDPSKLSCELLGLELAATHNVVETMLMDFRYLCFVNCNT